jgi:hypothetical protein
VTPEAGRRNPPVHFDDALFAADLRRLPQAGRDSMRAARQRYERDGLPAGERRSCQAHHSSGTKLPGCVKAYIPPPAGPWRLVFQIARFADGQLGLEYVAAGLGHPPQGRRRSVYDLAHFRLHGAWPRR